jgi:hypothetical protein
MKKNIYQSFILCSLLLFIFVNISNGQIGYSPRIDSVINLSTVSTVSKLDRELSGDTSTIIGGSPYTIVSRHYSTASNIKAAQFIYERMLSYGINARYMNNSATSVNVIGKKTGTKYPNQQYIICCHYDDMPSGTTAPGADDNASGVVGVFEAARLLANFNMDYTVLFIAFDEEERGLYGSYAYVDSAYAHGDSIVGVINLDMILYNGANDGKLSVITNTASVPLADDFITAISTYVPTLIPIKTISTTANSDHAPFWTKGWLAFMAIEDNNALNPYYHTVNDNFANGNPTFMNKMVKAAIAFLVSKANRYYINIIHTPIASGNNTGNRIATARINSPKGIGKLTNAPRLYYAVNNGTFTPINSYYQNLDTFKFSIPGVGLGNSVQYYIAAQDSLGQMVATLPAGGKGLNPPGFIEPPTFFSYMVGNIVQGCIGNGGTSVDYPFYTYYMDSRTDLLYTASEIQTAGGVPGSLITKIGFNVLSASSLTMNGFKIKMQQTTNSSISNFTSTGWTTVYDGTYTVSGTGTQMISLQNSFLWNGTSNLLIEICYNNSTWTTSTSVDGEAATGKVAHQHQDLSSGDGCVDITTPSTSYTARPKLCAEFNTSPSGIGNENNTPKVFSLSQNYPNPFNPETRINFSIPKASFVVLKIYDMLGREVALLVNEEKEAGEYILDFNGEKLSSGIYYCKLEAGNFTATRKMILLK